MQGPKLSPQEIAAVVRSRIAYLEHALGMPPQVAVEAVARKYGVNIERIEWLVNHTEHQLAAHREMS